MKIPLGNFRKTLTGKLALVVMAAALILTPTTYFVLQLAVAPSFSRLEQDTVQRQVDRVRNGVEDFGKEVVRATRDYAVWDDSYAYLESPSRAFEEETLSPLAQQNLDVDFFGYIRFDGRIVRGEAVDLVSGKRLTEESSLLSEVVTSPDFLGNATRTETYRTFVSTSRGVYALASGWIRKSDGGGTPQGFVVMGRLMGSQDLSQVLRVPVSIESGTALQTMPKAMHKPPHEMSISTDQAVERIEGLTGPDGSLTGIVRFSTPRSVSALGARTILLGTALVLAVMTAVLILLSVLVRLSAIRRLEQLADHMRAADDQPAFVPSPIGEGGDEIASLARSFDEIFEELRAVREKLREQGYAQGKVDSAAGALHNLRNALGPVRALQQKWMAEERASWRRHLAHAIAELNRHPEEPRKAALEAFVKSAVETVVSQADGRWQEMEESQAALNQAIDIIAGEHDAAHEQFTVEQLDVIEMLRPAVTIARHLGDSDIKITIPETAPLVLANRLQLGQLLANLLKNAAEAIYALDPFSKRIEVTVEVFEQSLRVLVRDNGEGFTAEVATSLFNRGFSTRREKKGGIGLHWCANSASAMKGSLQLVSEGPGCGASAILVLPLAEARSCAEAA